MPNHDSYDVIIIGGAMIGSSSAWFLTDNPDFDGSILVVERDPSYEFASTSRTNSCIRQQFSNELNVRISQFGVEFIKSFAERMKDPEAPFVRLQSYGYMYLADTPEMAENLRDMQSVQAAFGAGTKTMTPDEVLAAYPFYNMDGIICANHNLVNEGYFDGSTMFEWWRKKARQNGAEYITDEVVSIQRDGPRITGVTLKSGATVACGNLVNASGPAADTTARMAGLSLPVEPRKRFTWIFSAEEPLGMDLPLTIDPVGVHVRTDGNNYLAGCPPVHDPAAHGDFEMDHDIWEDHVWPTLANRIPAFERIKVINEWAGHYAFNTLDQNAIVGPDPEVPNFLYVNGFSGHGFQQSPAMGRAISELVTYGEYRTLDMAPMGIERVRNNEEFIERAVI